MTTIPNIHGLTVEKDEQRNLVVKFNGQAATQISDKRIECEENTSYRGEVLDRWTTFQTPVGVVERHFWQSGAGLERSGTDWRIVPVSEISEAQARFARASLELAEAESELKRLLPKGNGD